MILDQLLQHVTSLSIKEILLLEPDLMLDKPVVMATLMESAAQQAKNNF